MVLAHEDVYKKRKAYTDCVNDWWTNNVSKLEALPEQQNVYDVYRDFSVSIANDFSALGILDLHKSRGAFAAYWDFLETDLKSIAASGWNAELIPAEDILQSQFPEVLEELATNEARRDELEAVFNEVNELEEGEFDEENYEVFPKEVLSEYKMDLKSLETEIKTNTKNLKALEKRYKANAKEIDKQFKVELSEAKEQLKVYKKEKNEDLEKQQNDVVQDIETKIADLNDYGMGYSDVLDAIVKEIVRVEPKNNPLAFKSGVIIAKLARHNELTNELKTCKATVAEIKAKKEDLVAKAREKITPEEAKVLILTRFKEVLHNTVMDYVNRYERALITELETRFTKYQSTLVSILDSREEAASQLNNFLIELGYER